MKGFKYLVSFMMFVAVIIIPVVIVDARPPKHKLKDCSANLQCNKIPKLTFLADYKVDKSKKKLFDILKESLVEKKNERLFIDKRSSEKFSVILAENNQKPHLHNFTQASKLTKYNLSTLSQIKGCGSNQTVTIGYKNFNAGLTSWGDNLYLSIGVGVSNPKISISGSKGMCEPLTGLYINGSAANFGKGISATWYYDNKPSVDKISSTPTIGISIGVTSKIW